MARYVFVVQVIMIASESAFNNRGRVLDPFRSLLHPNVMEALIFCQSWLQAGNLPIVNEDIVDEIAQIVKDVRIYILKGLSGMLLY